MTNPTIIETNTDPNTERLTFDLTFKTAPLTIRIDHTDELVFSTSRNIRGSAWHSRTKDNPTAKYLLKNTNLTLAQYNILTN